VCSPPVYERKREAAEEGALNVPSIYLLDLKTGGNPLKKGENTPGNFPTNKLVRKFQHPFGPDTTLTGQLPKFFQMAQK